MVLSYDGVYLWKKAVEQAKSFDVEKVVAELEKGIEFERPGGKVTSQKNHHLTKNVFIGETKADGQFKILKEYKNVVGEPFLKGTFKASTAAKKRSCARRWIYSHGQMENGWSGSGSRSTRARGAGCSGD